VSSFVESVIGESIVAGHEHMFGFHEIVEAFHAVQTTKATLAVATRLDFGKQSVVGVDPHIAKLDAPSDLSGRTVVLGPNR
jgi:hypothetical protein